MTCRMHSLSANRRIGHIRSSSSDRLSLLIAYQSLASSRMENSNVAIVRLGTVGAGVARLLLDYGDRTARHAGRTLWLEQVVVKDPKKSRNVDLPAGLTSNDLSRITRDAEIKAVATLVGGIEPERTIILK